MNPSLTDLAKIGVKKLLRRAGHEPDSFMHHGLTRFIYDVHRNVYSDWKDAPVPFLSAPAPLTAGQLSKRFTK